MEEPRRVNRPSRISGKRALLTLGVLAAIFAGLLYWALLPFYTGGKEALRTTPAQPAEEPATPAPAPDEAPE